jgi:hypothetical protein
VLAPAPAPTRAGARRAQAAAANFIADAAMEATAASRADFAAQLADLGFLPAAYARACRDGGPMPAEAAAYDDHSGNARIVKAALCAGFYPAILRVEHPTAVFAETHGGALQKDADPARLKFFDRRRGARPARSPAAAPRGPPLARCPLCPCVAWQWPAGSCKARSSASEASGAASGPMGAGPLRRAPRAGRVFIHPASVNFTCGSFPSGFLVYTDIVETSKARRA